MTLSSPAPLTTPDQLAELFHTTYEQVTPQFGYETRRETAVPWDELPHPHKQMLIAVATQVLGQLVLAAQPDCACQTTEQATHPYGDDAFCMAAQGRLDEQAGDQLRERLRVALGHDELPDDDGLVADVEEWIRRGRALSSTLEEKGAAGA